MGLSWSFVKNKNRSYIVDTELPFGSHKASQIFKKLSNAIAQMLKDCGINVVNYLDDLLVVSALKNTKLAGHEITINILVSSWRSLLSKSL